VITRKSASTKFFDDATVGECASVGYVASAGKCAAVAKDARVVECTAVVGGAAAFVW